MAFSSFKRRAVTSTVGASWRSAFKQPEDAMVVARRAEQHRADEPVAEFLRQVLEDLVARGRHVGEQLLHQLVVVVGELFQHVETRFLLTFRHGGGKLDDLRMAHWCDR